MLKRMLDSLTDSLTTQDPPVAATTAPLMTDHKLGGPYRPLLKRPTSSKGGRGDKGGRGNHCYRDPPRVREGGRRKGGRGRGRGTIAKETHPQVREGGRERKGESCRPLLKRLTSK